MHFLRALKAEEAHVFEPRRRGFRGLVGRSFSPAAYIAVSLLLLGVTLLRPVNTWDMIGYIAAAKEADLQDPVSLHTWVFTEVRELIGEREFDRINHTPYRQAITEDPEALRQQLPFYRVRFLYVAAINGLTKLGFNPVLSSHLVPVLACILGLWVLRAALARRIRGPMLGAVPFFALAFGIITVANDPTPDGLAFFMVSVVVLLVMRESRWVFVFTPLCVLVRADLAMFVLPVLLFQWLRTGAGKLTFGLSVAATVLAAVAVCRWSGYYGIGTLLYCNYNEFLPYPQDTEFQLRLADYLVGWKQGLRKVLHNAPFFTYLAVLIASIVALSGIATRTRGESTKWLLLACSTIYVAAHFVLFPTMSERFFLGQYMMASVALLWILWEGLGGEAAPADA